MADPRDQLPQEVEAAAEEETPVENFPAGTVGVLTDQLSRYSMFSASLTMTRQPPGSRMAWAIGSSIVDNMNSLVHQTIGDWLWVLGDDHAWGPYTLARILRTTYDRDLDIVVPLCVRRGWPWDIVAYSHIDPERGYTSIKPEEMAKDADPVVEVLAAGTAGMLIRKRVLDALEEPWFESGAGKFEGVHEKAQLGEDVYFCMKAKELGFKVWADTSIAIGHMNVHTAWPGNSTENGEWGVEMNFGGDNSIFIPRKSIVVP